MVKKRLLGLVLAFSVICPTFVGASNGSKKKEARWFSPKQKAVLTAASLIPAVYGSFLLYSWNPKSDLGAFIKYQTNIPANWLAATAVFGLGLFWNDIVAAWRKVNTFIDNTNGKFKKLKKYVKAMEGKVIETKALASWILGYVTSPSKMLSGGVGLAKKNVEKGAKNVVKKVGRAGSQLMDLFCRAKKIVWSDGRPKTKGDLQVIEELKNLLGEEMALELLENFHGDEIKKFAEKHGSENIKKLFDVVGKDALRWSFMGGEENEEENKN